jgi:hypothetical protein
MDDPVIFGGVDAYLIDEALNNWVSSSTGFTYYTWAWGDTLGFVKE